MASVALDVFEVVIEMPDVNQHQSREPNCMFQSGAEVLAPAALRALTSAAPSTSQKAGTSWSPPSCATTAANLSATLTASQGAFMAASLAEILAASLDACLTASCASARLLVAGSAAADLCWAVGLCSRSRRGNGLRDRAVVLGSGAGCGWPCPAIEHGESLSEEEGLSSGNIGRPRIRCCRIAVMLAQLPM